MKLSSLFSISIFETDAKFVAQREKRSIDTLELLQKSLNDQQLVAVPQTKETPLSDGNPFSFDVTLENGFSNFDDLSNFVIISCNQNCENPSGWKSDNGFKYVGNVRESTEEFFGDYPSWRPKIENRNKSGFRVKFENVKNQESFLVVGMKDLLHPDPVAPIYSNNVYKPNIYKPDTLNLYYVIRDGKPYLKCEISSTGEADLHFDFTSSEAPNRGSNFIESAGPSSDWLSVNSDRDEHVCKYPLGQASVSKFPTLQDAYENAKSYLAGDTMELEFWPVPSTNPANIDIYYGHGGGQGILENKIENVDKNQWQMHDDHLDLNSLTALENMKGAIIVAFKDKENNILGFSSPYPIKVYDKPTPRLDIEAKIYDHKCGFDLEAEKQAVASCKTVNNGKTDVDFPQTKLQWKVEKTDGSSIVYPNRPTSAVNVELKLKLDDSLRGAKLFCIDSRESEDDRSTDAATDSIKNLKIKEKTSKIVIKVSNSEVVCESDIFGVATNEENQCSDIQSFKTQKTLCPAAMHTLSHANCTAELISGEEMWSEPFNNEECLDNVEEVPCSKSASAPCPPKLEEVSEGGTMVWLICFIIAACLGGILIFLNRRKTQSYSPQEQDLKEESSAEFHVQEETSPLKE